MTSTALSASLRALAHKVIGRTSAQLTTPALVLDIDLAQRNIDSMAAQLRNTGVALRPHIKVHKSTQLARLQITAGAVGVSTATVWEALAMARAGIRDVFIVNEVTGDAKLTAITETARHAAVSVAADHKSQLRALSDAATSAGVELGVLIDVDTGMGRCGVRDPAEALALARELSRLSGLGLRGVSGYEGHCMREPVRERRAEMVGHAMAKLAAVADELIADGHPCPIVSAGGTGTYDLTAAHPRVTEIQAGSYVVMDDFHGSLIDGFEFALTVVSTVISQHGDHVVLDAGRKAVGADLRSPRPRDVDATVLFVDEEHTGLQLTDPNGLSLGDTVSLIPGYAPTAVNLYDVIHVMSSGHVVDLWPVQARYGAATVG